MVCEFDPVVDRCRTLTRVVFAVSMLGCLTHTAQGAEPDVPVLEQGMVPLPDGGHLAFHVRPGTGPVLVLIPGSWGDRHVYDEVLMCLDDSLHVVIVELRGHGESWPPTLEGSIESFADDVLRVTDALDIRHFFVGGHSIGGMIAVELAGRRPRTICGAVSIEGWTHHQVQRDAFGHINVSTLDSAEEAKRLAARQRVLQNLTQEQITSFATIWKQWDGLPILQSTETPILELWGDRGHDVPTREIMRIPDRPGIRLVWLADASHSLLIECPAEVATQINRFTAELSRSCPAAGEPHRACSDEENDDE